MLPFSPAEFPLLLDALQRLPVFLQRDTGVEAGLIAQQILTPVVDPGLPVLVAQFDRLAGGRIAVRLHTAHRLRPLLGYAIRALLRVLVALPLDVAHVLGILGDDGGAVAHAIVTKNAEDMRNIQ